MVSASQVENSVHPDVTASLLEMDKLSPEQLNIISKNKKVKKELEDNSPAWKYVRYSDGQEYASLRHIIVTTAIPKESASLFGLAANESKPVTVVGIKERKVVKNKETQVWTYHVITDVKKNSPAFQTLYATAIKDAIEVFKNNFEMSHPPRPLQVATETEQTHRRHSSGSRATHRTERRTH